MMTRRTISIAFAVLAIMTWGLFAKAQPDSPIAYPLNYLSWAHIKRGNSAARGGIHHIYANEKAMEGYRTGQFPDGSVIVFDLIETKESAGTTIEGARKLIDVMVKERQRYAETGGWGFEEFKGDSQAERMLNADAKAACYKCHATQEAHGFVFSKLGK